MLKTVTNLFFQGTVDSCPALFVEVSALINEAVNAVIITHGHELIGANINYIIWAIWGSDNENKLDETQKQINDYIVPVLGKIVSLFKLNKPTKEQTFAIEYLIRSLLVTRIGYAIEKHISRDLLSTLTDGKLSH